ncbi:MAG: NAD(P)-dependent oxidoreductase [Planctomycetota bacterium]
MQIAITGGTGFLGRHLLAQLAACQHDLVVLSRRSPESLPTLDHVRWLQGELGNQESAARLVTDCDVVIHSALSRTRLSFLEAEDKPLQYWHQNATSSLQLLEAAANAAVSRFVFVSSGAVHDQVVGPLNEDHPLRPSTLYGACKASVETLVHHYGQSGRLVATTLRPTAIYGEAEPMRASKWFDLVKRVAAGQTVNVSGGAKSVHAADVAKAIVLLMQTNEQAVAGETFNCCDRMISDYEVADLAKSLSGSEAVIQGVPKQAKHQIDSSKLMAMGMRFGGDALLRKTVENFIRYSDDA